MAWRKHSLRVHAGRRLLRDERGVSLVEFSLIAWLLIVVTFGVVEFAFAMWQWNSAEKATHLGSRMAVVANPVATELKDFDCGEGTTLAAGSDCSAPGAQSFGTIVCRGQTSQCTGDDTYNFDDDTFNAIVARMQNLFPRIRAENVVIEYEDLGLGYVKRSGPVPLVTVRLEGMTYEFIVLSMILPNPITMPAFRATLTGEALDSGAQ